MSAPFPEVEVAVAVIRREDKILAVYNPHWHSFSLPMTKLRRWQDPNTTGGEKLEAPRVAAARAAAEFLGRTFTAAELPEDPACEPITHQQSDRDGKYKRYCLHVFQITLEGDVTLVDGAVGEWLTRIEILNKSRAPISPTVRVIVEKLSP